MYVKPNPEKTVEGKVLKVFDPARKEFLPEQGRDVPQNSYWIRRLQSGDVVKAVAGEAPAKKQEANKSTAKTNNAKTAKVSIKKGKTEDVKASDVVPEENTATSAEDEKSNEAPAEEDAKEE